MTNATRTQVPSISKKSLWTGRGMTAFVGLFLLFDAMVKVLQLAPAMEGSAELGYRTSTVFGIGVVALVCVALYLVPRTAIFGALLLTGYLGGAIATHVRVGNPLFSHTLFPIYVAALVWGSLYLRDPRLRALLRPWQAVEGATA